MYSKEKADRAVKFISQLKHTKDPWAGVPFVLEPWQEKDIIRPLFGTVKKDGTRQYRTFFGGRPRKNGKTEEAAAVALYMLSADGERGAEVYSAAVDREQASIVFHVATEMVRQNRALAKRCKIIESTKRIIYTTADGYRNVYRVLSSDHASAHGYNASAVICDELHAWPNRKLWDALTTSGGTRTQPLVFVITTAGYDRTSICWEMWDYAKRLLSGAIKDPTFLPVIYDAPEDADWTDERVWKLANPALGVFRSLDEMRSLYTQAKNTPALQNTFRRLYLNQWTSAESRWIDIADWDATAGEVWREDLAGETAYGGLDLATTKDIAAFVLDFPDEDGCHDILPFFFVNEAMVEERDKKGFSYCGHTYSSWAREGFLEITPGNVIDYRYIRKRVNELGEEFHIAEIAYDKWGATELVQNLGDDGFEMFPFGQGFLSMSASTKELEKLILSRRLRHGGHPILRWHIDNVMVRQDPNGKLRPDRDKSTEKIDGTVATIMAIDRAIRNTKASVYDERGLLMI